MWPSVSTTAHSDGLNRLRKISPGDLAAHQGATGAELAREMVAIASRPLAEWLTYEALALRTGDPFDEFVKKAVNLDGGLAGDLSRIRRWMSGCRPRHAAAG